MFPLFMAELTTAVLRHNNFFYLFDWHSSDMHGLYVLNGRSVLIKFEILLEIESYIQVNYLEFKDKMQSYFEIQFINIDIDRTQNCQNSYERINENRLNK